MKFREWLYKIEEVQRSRNYGNPDMTTALGPLSQYGQRAMKPVSLGVDNRAFAGVVDGIGQARSKVRAEMGAEPGVASQYHSLEDVRKDAITAIYVPLQTPVWYNHGSSKPIYRTKGLVQQIKAKGDPLDPSLMNGFWLTEKNNNTRIAQPKGQPSTYLYTFTEEEDAGMLNSAINYTEAMMVAHISSKLNDYSIYLKTETPQRHYQKIETVPLGDEFTQEYLEKNPNVDLEEKRKKVNCKIMMCSWVIESKNQGDVMDRETRDEVDRLLGNDTSARTQGKPPVATPVNLPGTSSATVSA